MVTGKHKETDEIKGFKKVMNELLGIKEEKSQDYGDSWKLFGLDGIRNHVMNKAFRIWNLRDRIPKNESIRDSYRDLAIYCIMAIQLIDAGETKPKI